MENQDFISPYIPNTESDRRLMLETIGVESTEELFEDIPEDHRNPTLSLPKPLSELDLSHNIKSLANQNAVPGDYSCFLGAGSYRHYIPAVVRQIVSRGEYMTSYTPYQPEIAQGTLQTTYEFQSLICQLTGMEVANAGMYDGATALAEGALMSARLTGRKKIAVVDSVSPNYVEVLKTYSTGPSLTVCKVTSENPKLDSETACLIVQQPNYTGYLENIEYLSETAHAYGALLVVCCDPIYLGMFRSPAEFDADIIVGEGQSLGISSSFGGPYVGIFTCKEKFLRQMPGRIVGKTVDTKGRTGYVLTLQTREQHIRRERATSNICTSVALIALTATVWMATLGKCGIKRIAENCYHKSHYAASLIKRIPGYSLPIEETFFREFVVRCPTSPSSINEQLLNYGILGGLDINTLIPNGMLVCVTEMNSRDEIDTFAKALEEITKTK